MVKTVRSRAAVCMVSATSYPVSAHVKVAGRALSVIEVQFPSACFTDYRNITQVPTDSN